MILQVCLSFLRPREFNMHFRACVLLLTVTWTVTYGNMSITFPQVSDRENSISFKHPEEVAEPINNSLREVASHVADLGLHTLKDLLTGHSNIIISPLNVYSCLGILNVGAVGDTKEEIRRVLGPTDENYSVKEIVKSTDGVSYASALFLNHGFVPRKEFLETTAAEFQASVLNVNMSDGERTRDTINNWVSEHTNGTIENLLQSRLNPNSKMVIVSALLFKGRWLHAFPSAATAPGKFETAETSIDVPFMHLFASVPLLRDPHFDAISLPYIDAQGMTMHVILPKEREAQAIRNLLSRLTPASLRKLRKESLHEEIFIALPKMTVGGRFSLTDSLKKQGISTMFNPSTANFNAVTEDSVGLYVSQVYHSIHFEMNEEGTVASAATASILTKSSKFVFRANRPFIFVITDKSDFILFMGVIVNPVP